jgi:hypothetical protein
VVALYQHGNGTAISLKNGKLLDQVSYHISRGPLIFLVIIIIIIIISEILK